MAAEVNDIELRKHGKDLLCCDSEASLDEFLEHEMVCWLNEDKPIGEEVATLRPELYGELNNLFQSVNEADNRCVEEILHEAELLMKDMQDADKVHSPYQWSATLHEIDEIAQEEHNRMFDLCLQTVQVFEFDSAINYNATSKQKHLDTGLDKTVTANLLVRSGANKPNGTSQPISCMSTKSTHQRRHLDRSSLSEKEEMEQVVCNQSKTRPLLEMTLRQRYNKLKQSSSQNEELVHQNQDRETADQYESWSKERLLEGKITDLQERLKDTEERYHSLKLQYDTLSQVHRSLRDNHGSMQEESEKLQFDIQHLTKCAELLRSELHAARSDRDSAIELQKILQCDLEESRKERKKLQDGCEKDTKNIQDLQRQCREMERILMRKNPDSVSALIVACKSEQDNSSTTCRLLEQRIAQLESDARKQDAKAQRILADVQARFNSVQAKYETHIADLEMQVLSLQEINSKLNEKIIRQMEELATIGSYATDSVNVSAKISTARSTQTDMLLLDERFDQTIKREGIETRSIVVQTDTEHVFVRQQQQPPQQLNAKRTHIQGKEDAHLLATIRGMRVDLAIKEKAVQRLTRELEECKKTIKKMQKKKEPLAIKCDNGRSPVKVRNKLMDSAEVDNVGALREAQAKVKDLELDYRTLQEKRLQDLKTLQAAHEKEHSSCHESIRFLQQRLVESEEELHHRKEKQRPGHNNDYYGLKAKVAYLERRHSEREQRLLMLVEALSK